MMFVLNNVSFNNSLSFEDVKILSYLLGIFAYDSTTKNQERDQFENVVKSTVS